MLGGDEDGEGGSYLFPSLLFDLPLQEMLPLSSIPAETPFAPVSLPQLPLGLGKSATTAHVLLTSDSMKLLDPARDTTTLLPGIDTKVRGSIVRYAMSGWTQRCIVQ